MIRKAKLEDFDGVHKVFLEVHKFHLENAPHIFKDVDPVTLDEYKEMLEDKNRFIIVSDNNGIDGFLDATIKEKNSKTSGYRKQMFIEHLGVLKSTQKSGVGGALMEEAEKYAKEIGCTIIMLDVWGFNHNAIGFYEHIGFDERTKKMQKFI